MFELGLAFSALGLGLRHGIDVDHIAALFDITSSQKKRREGMVLATLYIVGHAVVVAVLGFTAVMLSAHIPVGLDSVMGRVTGLTLIVLGLYVVYSLARSGRQFRLRSRWMLIAAAMSSLRRRLQPTKTDSADSLVISHDHEHAVSQVHDRDGELAMTAAGRTAEQSNSHRHPHDHVGSIPNDPFMAYGRASSVAVGMIHGIGAETPTQLLLFTTAASMQHTAGGLFVVLFFVLGLLASNALIALVSTFGFIHAAHSFSIYVAVSLAMAAFSVSIGANLLLG